MKYFYTAKDIKGQKQTGEIEATSKEAALEVISKNDLFPIEVKSDGSDSGSVMDMKINLPSRVSLKDVAMFSRQLSIMIDSNVPPAEAIEALGDQTKGRSFKEKIYKISKDVREGTTLSKALAKHSNVFSIFYINMVKSGEASGSLPSILTKIADHLESEYEIRQKTMGAMIYPAVILVIFILIFVIIMIFVIPGLVEVLRGSGQELPFATKLIISVSDFFVNYWYVVFTLLFGLIAASIYLPKTIKGKDVYDRVVLKVPVISGFLKNLFMARFAENFSTLISAGVPINEALEIISDLVGNNVYRDLAIETKNRVVKGETVSNSLAKYPEAISPLFVQMVAVGEQTGRLDSSLVNIVRFYKREAEVFVDSLSSVIEPIMIIGLALMTGFLVAAVLLPIYKISTTIQQ
jgi:type IV pilus assembly protein PilC